MNLSKESENALVEISKTRRVYLEGNILKLLKTESDEFKNYLDFAKKQDKEKRENRLAVTKKVQQQNSQLEKKAEENSRLMSELQEALHNVENAKKEVEQDLDFLQKKTQFELIGNIVNVALYVILGVGILTTLLYCYALYYSIDTTLIGNAWSNMFGILLTNSFSIIGTIMGVKYASNDSAKK